MQTVGQYFRSERRAKKLGIADVEELTKIKKSFLRGIEKTQWNILPEYPVLLGFVKNIAKALDLNENKAVALFRRDYPTQKQAPAPKPDLPREFHWGPRLTFALGVLVIVVALLGYLAIQYASFIRPPKLEVFEPTQDQIVRKPELKVTGKTNPDVSIKVNNQPVLVTEEGNFETNLQIFEGTFSIEIVAVSRSGKETRVQRTINPQL